jgi:hypothetical protein
MLATRVAVAQKTRRFMTAPSREKCGAAGAARDEYDQQPQQRIKDCCYARELFAKINIYCNAALYGVSTIIKFCRF